MSSNLQEYDLIDQEMLILNLGIIIFRDISFAKILNPSIFGDNPIYDFSGGHVIPKGTTVTVLAYMMHRDPKFFPEPESFIPERFDVGNKFSSPFAYVPFSAGPRNCIGELLVSLYLSLRI